MFTVIIRAIIAVLAYFLLHLIVVIKSNIVLAEIKSPDMNCSICIVTFH